MTQGLKVTDWYLLIMIPESEGHRLASSYNDTRLKVTDWHLLIMIPESEGHRLASSYNDTRV